MSFGVKSITGATVFQSEECRCDQQEIGDDEIKKISNSLISNTILGQAIVDIWYSQSDNAMFARQANGNVFRINMPPVLISLYYSADTHQLKSKRLGTIGEDVIFTANPHSMNS